MEVNRNTGGGSSLTTVKRARKKLTSTESKQHAVARVRSKLGSTIAEELKKSFDELDDNRLMQVIIIIIIIILTAVVLPLYNIPQDGMVASLITQGYSEIEIRSFLGIGGYRFCRIKSELSNPLLREQKQSRVYIPKHALSKADMERIIAVQNGWKVENGFPCSHRRLRRFFTEEKVSWFSLWLDYAEQMKQSNYRIVSYSRWLQYIHFMYPELSLSRTKVDLCNGIVLVYSVLSILTIYSILSIFTLSLLPN